jgi:hypothetical protein
MIKGIITTTITGEPNTRKQRHLLRVQILSHLMDPNIVYNLSAVTKKCLTSEQLSDTNRIEW